MVPCSFAHEALQDISFHTSMFILQIHGLPPVFHHKGTSEKIENQIGVIYEEMVNRRCMLANQYLRFKVEISINNLIQVGFF